MVFQQSVVSVSFSGVGPPVVISSMFFVDMIPVLDNSFLFADILVVPCLFCPVCISNLVLGCSPVKHFVQFFIKLVWCNTFPIFPLLA